MYLMHGPSPCPDAIDDVDVLLSGFDGERRAGGWVDPLLRHRVPDSIILHGIAVSMQTSTSALDDLEHPVGSVWARRRSVPGINSHSPCRGALPYIRLIDLRPPARPYLDSPSVRKPNLTNEIWIF